jgi:TonB family protein
VLVLIVVIAFLLTRSHQAEPASPIAEEQPAATASRPRPSPYPANHSSKAAPVKNEVALPGDVVERVMPDIPQKAIGTIRGTVKVSIRLTVGPDGEVSNAAIDSPGSTYFATRAQQAAEHWKFKPAQVNGHIVSSEWILHFVFTSTETQVTPVRVSP